MRPRRAGAGGAGGRRRPARTLGRALLAGAAVGLAALALLPARAQVPTLPTLPGGTTTTQAPTTTTVTEAPTTTTEAPTTTSTTGAVPDTTLPPSPLEVPTTVAVPPDAGTTTTVLPPSPVEVDPEPSPQLVALSAAAVSGAYGVGVAGVLGFALVLIGFASAIRPGGLPMTDQRRSRLYAAIAILAAAAVVGLVGYLKLSLEPQVNRQIPYLASAGMALVLLAAIGGALLVGEQMRTDEQRIAELEDAVKTLAGALSASIEAPARRGGHVAVLEAEAADEAEAAELAQTVGAPAPTRARRRRP